MKFNLVSMIVIWSYYNILYSGPARRSWGPGINSLEPFLSIFIALSSRRPVPVAKPGFSVKAGIARVC